MSWASKTFATSMTLVVEAKAIEADLWQQPHPPEIDYDLHQRLHDEGRSDEATQLWRDHQDRKNAWGESMRQAISLGKISPEEAVARGHRHQGEEEDRDRGYSEDRPARGWQQMPDPMYHVTTNAPAVHEHGLKTRSELDQDRGLGLGGGASNTISFTTDESIAHDIHRGIREMRQVARGERTVPQMIEEAKAGKNADRPYWAGAGGVSKYYGSERGEMTTGLDRLVRGMRGISGASSFADPHRPREPGDWRPSPGAETWQHKGTGEALANSWERPATEGEKREDAIEFAKNFSAYRERAGGPSDPLFFSSDAHKLADIPEHHIQILKAHPKPGAKGYPMSGMKEWRTSAGGAVDVEPEPVRPQYKHKLGASNVPFGAPLDEAMSRENQDVISGGNPRFKSFGEEEEHAELEKQGAKTVTHAGLALLAGDTGRVLTLQRALSDDDPAAGKFEFPGGGIEEGEAPIEGAIREWKEETGCPLPPGHVADSWLSNGMYRGFVYVVPSEDVLQINGSAEDRQVLNPDDPDQDNIEVVLWMHPKDLKANPATRKEVKSGTDWSVFSKARRRAMGAKAKTYYHVSPTRLPVGTKLTPGGGRRNFGGNADSDAVYMAGSEGDAEQWGNAMAQDDYVGHLHIYEVKPHGQVTTSQGHVTSPEGTYDMVEQHAAPSATIIRHHYSYDPQTGEAFYPHEATAATTVACECGHDQSEHSRGRGTCDSCWRDFMDHFQDYYQGIGPEVSYCKRYKGDRAKTAAEDDWASRVHVRDGHLENPEDRSLEWHHGSPANWDKEPEEHDYDDSDYGYEPPEQHWNTHLGTHWTSHPEVAEQFAEGMYDKERTRQEVREDPGQVYTANLGIKSPKVYRSESDMDKEAYDRAWEGEDPEYPHDPGRGEPETARERHDNHSDRAHWLSSHPESEEIASEFKRNLQSQGHDGIVYGNEMEGPHNHPCAITFDGSQEHNVQRRWANQRPGQQLKLFEAKVASKFGHIAMSDRADYGMGHSPNDDGPPVHNLTEEGSYAPEDLYTHMHYYGTGDDRADAESMAAIRKAKWDNIRPRAAMDNSKWRERGLDFEDHEAESPEDFQDRLDRRKAGEHHVTVYRAAPRGAKTINTGDWVTLSRTYARGHSKHPDDKAQDMPVYESRVPAKHVRWPADSINEFGYFGPEAKAKVSLRGGKNAPRVEPQAREGAMKITLANQDEPIDLSGEDREAKRRRGEEIAEHLWNKTQDIFDPVGTSESRHAERSMAQASKLLDHYQPQHIHYDEDDDPYAMVEHRTGWQLRDYGGPNLSVHHKATGEDAHDALDVSESGTPQGQETGMAENQHPGWDSTHLMRHLDHWVRNYGQDYADNMSDPRIRRFNRRHNIRYAAEEIVVPRNIDTLRDSTCAVCGSVDSMNGDRCTVCGYMATPQAFQSPDTSLAPKVRDELGIGSPDGDDMMGAPDAGLEGPPGAEDDLEDMGEGPGGPEGLEGEEGAPGGADLMCNNCGAQFNSEEEEEDLSQPYMSPAARVEPDVSALGVEDEMEVAREVAQGENQAGTNQDVAYQEGDECPVCAIGTLEPFEGDDEEGLPGEEPGPNDFGGEAAGGAPEGDEELPPGEEEEPEEEVPPGGQEGPDDQEEAPPEEEDEDVVPSEDEDDEEEDEDEGPPFRRQRKVSSTMAITPGAQRSTRSPVPNRRQPPPQRRQVTAAAPNPAALERQRLHQALAATSRSLNIQADRLQAQDRLLAQMGRFVRQASTKITELNVRNETLERQMALVANASGLMEPLATIGAAGQARVAALYRQANPSNPAQPVPEPPSEPPVFTSSESAQSEGRDDVTQLGASPVTNVEAAATTSVDLPYGELANQPVGMTRTDVTAPVQGTETATPPEMTVIPVDARIGDPNDPQVAFPFTVGPVGAPSRPYAGPSVGSPPTTAARANGQRPEPGVAVHPQAQAQAHYIASVNLARLRAQVGITNEEPFQLGTKIASSMNDAQINAEAQGLQAVASRQAAQPAPQYFAPGPAFEPVQATGIPDARPMVPHLAAAPGSSVLPADPSFQAGKYGTGPGAAIQGTTMFAPRTEEFGWDSPV
jgi:8-oxo-dGTP pyrophosphatase MutT (NUDIX family)